MGEAIGMIRFTPWEAVVVAADIAMKKREYPDRLHGPLLRFPDYYRQAGGSGNGRGERWFVFLMKSWVLKPVRSIKAKERGGQDDEETLFDGKK